MFRQDGSCVRFNGTEQYISLEPLDFSSLLDGFSISFWFKHEPREGTNATNTTTIFDFSNGSGACNIAFGKTAFAPNATLLISASSSEWHTETIQQGFPPYVWKHYVWVVQRTGSLSTWRVYQDGVLVLQAKRRSYPRARTTLNYIGRSRLGFPYFVGKMDSFGVFQWPLQQAHAAMLVGTKARFV